MKKVLILAPFYPPCNLTAAYRPYSWAKYLHKFGYYPIIFCRNLVDERSYYTEKTEHFEVHYINYKDHYIHNKRVTVKNTFVRRMFGLIDYLLENSIKYNGVGAIEELISRYISDNMIELMIATAPDYSIFGLAYKLSTKHKIKWIADYRDDWTSTELHSGFFFGLKNNFDKVRERRYLRSCSFFSTVSDYYIRKISAVIHKEGYLVENGFEPDENIESIKSNGSGLTILYPGTLYNTQKLDIIGEAMDILPRSIADKISFTFLGSEASGLAIPVSLKKYLEKNVFFIKRVDRKIANQFLNDSDLLLFVGHQGETPIKGIPSSKLYEFIRLRKAVLVCPSDHDIVEKKLTTTGQGIFCNTASELANNIRRLLAAKEKTGFIPRIDIPPYAYISNTREFQTGEMAKILDRL